MDPMEPSLDRVTFYARSMNTGYAWTGMGKLYWRCLSAGKLSLTSFILLWVSRHQRTSSLWKPFSILLSFCLSGVVGEPLKTSLWY